MSYINDALRRAQKDKDNRYEPFGGVIAPSPEGPERRRKRRAMFGAAVALVVLVFAALLFVVYGLQQPSGQKKGARLPEATVAEKTAPKAEEKTVRPPEGPTGTRRADAGYPPSAEPRGAQPQVTEAEKPLPKAAEEAFRKPNAPPAKRKADVRQQPSARPKGALVPEDRVAEKPAPKAVERAVRPPEGPPEMRDADVRYQEALIAQWAGDLRQAEALYEKVLALDPGHVQALNNLGVIYMGQKKREKAIAVFGRAVVLKKDYVDPYYNLACLYAQTNEIDESLWYLKVAAAIDGGVINWVKKDADMKNVAASPEFKKLMEGQKN